MNLAFRTGMIAVGVRIIPILPIVGRPQTVVLQVQNMTQWKLKAVAFAILALACCPVHAEENAGNRKQIISHACATPLQSPAPKQVSFVPATNKTDSYHPIVSTASQPNQSPADLTAPSTTPTKATHLPGLNTQSNELAAEDEISDELKNNPLASSVYVQGPLGIRIKYNMLSPMTPQPPKQPAPHEPENSKAGKIPNRLVVLGKSRNTPEDLYSSTNEELSDPVLSDDTGTDLETKAYQSGDVINFSDTKSTSEMAMTPLPAENSPQTIEADKRGLIVHPPMVQPYNRNQYTFILENLSDTLAKEVAVEIGVPDHCKIIATLPSNSLFSKNQCVFRFEELPAGDRVQIHVNAVSDETKPVEFVANVVSRSVFEFARESSNRESPPTDISYNLDSAEPTIQNRDQDLGNGSVLVRNPFVASERRQDGKVYR